MKKAASETRAQKAQREAEKRARLERIEQETKRRRLASADIDYDPRTAQGGRAIDVVSLGPAMRVSINHLLRCFPRRFQRTDARVLAWSEFDEHYQRATAGLIGVPSFEAPVDGSATPGGNVNVSRLDAIARDKELQQWLGAGHVLLVLIIHLGHSYEELEERGHPDAARRFAAALDRAAVFFEVADKFIDPAAYRALETTRQAFLQESWNGRAFSHAEAREMAMLGHSVRAIAQYFGVSYRLTYSVVGDIVGGQESPTLKKWRGKKKGAV